MPEARVGVYVCHCGTNIAGTVDVASVAQYIGTLPNVVVSRDYKYMCSNTGQEMIKEDIHSAQLDRVVVAACSPRMHEVTFRRVLSEAGLNPYLLNMANIREQCSWITKDTAKATEKAKELVRAAVARSIWQEPLEEREAEVIPKALVVGGGVAGIQAALSIANAGYHVYLVEKEPTIGGRMAQLDKTFPTLDCSACILTPKMVDVANNKNITLLTYSEVTQVSGYVGNFKVKVRQKPRYVNTDLCNGCGLCAELCVLKDRVPAEFEAFVGKRAAIYIPFPQAVPRKATVDPKSCLMFVKTKKCAQKCVQACGPGAIDFSQKEVELDLEVGTIILATGHNFFDAKLLPQYNYGVFPNIITSMEFERMCNASGPTGGKIVLQNGETPKSVAFIHCVGCRDHHSNTYCSRLCCMHAMKQAHLVKEKTGADVYELYIDIRAGGKGYEEFYERVQREGVIFIRGRGAEVMASGNQLAVRAEDTGMGRPIILNVDMVVLVNGMVAREDAAEVAQTFHVTRDKDGFFLEAHPKLRPFNTNTEGVLLAGTCQGPKDIPDAIAHANAAAAEALAIMGKGRVTIEPTIASVNSDQCGGCKTCIGLCAYSAISFNDDNKTAEVNAALCKGCGTCVAACPSGAITARHFTDKQILAEIEAILAGAEQATVRTSVGGGMNG